MPHLPAPLTAERAAAVVALAAEQLRHAGLTLKGRADLGRLELSVSRVSRDARDPSQSLMVMAEKHYGAAALATMTERAFVEQLVRWLRAFEEHELQEWLHRTAPGWRPTRTGATQGVDARPPAAAASGPGGGPWANWSRRWGRS